MSLSTLDDLLEPLASYVSTVAEKLRGQKLVTGHIQVFLETNPHTQGRQYSAGIGRTLDRPTSFTPDLATVAAELLRQIHRPGCSFRKVGVIVTDLRQETEVQSSFDAPSPEIVSRRRVLMATLDRVNTAMGRGTVRLASAGTTASVWKMRQANLSPCYTTRWDELLRVRA